jgi:hypothetical protein
MLHAGDIGRVLAFMVKERVGRMHLGLRLSLVALFCHLFRLNCVADFNFRQTNLVGIGLFLYKMG